LRPSSLLKGAPRSGLAGCAASTYLQKHRTRATEVWGLHRPGN
jgi:hypothetical protein